MTGSVSGAQLRAFIERIERLEEEKRTIADDIKEVKAEAKGSGFDLPTINAILKLRKKDAAERDEAQAMLDLYMSALGMLPLFERDGVTVMELGREPAQSYAKQKGRELVQEMHEFDPETGEITNEPEAAAEVAGDYLREPVAAEQGQIIREGDAPRETDRLGGDASRPDAEYSHSQAIPSKPTDMAGEVNPSSRASSATNSDDIDLTIPAFLDHRQPKAREWENA